MKTFSTADLARKIGDVTHAASQAPIAITHHNKPRYVMMSVDEFIARDPRRVYATRETPHELAEELITSMEEYLAQTDPRGKNAAA